MYLLYTYTYTYINIRIYLLKCVLRIMQSIKTNEKLHLIFFDYRFLEIENWK